MAHPYANNHETKVSRRRVGKILSSGGASAAHEKVKHIYPGIHGGGSDAVANKVPGKTKPGRFARGGKVKGHRTNIAIVVPQKSAPPSGGPQGGPASPPMAGPPPPMPMPMPPPGAGPGGPGGPGGPPGMPPPPMRARGGKVIGGEATAGNLKSWSKRASKNSYARGGRLPTAGAESGVGRLQKAK